MRGSPPRPWNGPRASRGCSSRGSGPSRSDPQRTGDLDGGAPVGQRPQDLDLPAGEEVQPVSGGCISVPPQPVDQAREVIGRQHKLSGQGATERRQHALAVRLGRNDPTGSCRQRTGGEVRTVLLGQPKDTRFVRALADDADRLDPPAVQSIQIDERSGRSVQRLGLEGPHVHPTPCPSGAHRRRAHCRSAPPFDQGPHRRPARRCLLSSSPCECIGTDPTPPEERSRDTVDMTTRRSEPARERDQPVPAAARPQPGGLVPVGPRGARAARGARTSRSCSRSATRPATGAT